MYVCSLLRSTWGDKDGVYLVCFGGGGVIYREWVGVDVLSWRRCAPIDRRTLGTPQRGGGYCKGGEYPTPTPHSSITCFEGAHLFPASTLPSHARLFLKAHFATLNAAHSKPLLY